VSQTYTGSILVALNPYKAMPALYNPDALKRYERAPLGAQPPHIFALAEDAYRRLDRAHPRKSLLISGESGAGKTESTKLILSYLTYLSGTHSPVEQLLLESSPILEAFGNATTTANDNSSRFVRSDTRTHAHTHTH
jgi:myosin heavy subunit